MAEHISKIEEAAEKIRASARATSIPVDVKRIVESLGLSLMTTNLNDSLSGALLRKERFVVVNKNHPLTRKRFTIAHEIGHHELHINEAEFVDGIFKRDKSFDAGTQRLEMEANQFAAALLMPSKEVESAFRSADFSSGDFVSDLADKFKVSRESMNYRLINLGLAVL